MNFEQAMQWLREHQEKGAYGDLTDAIWRALMEDDDERLGRYVIESFERAIEGAISPELAARDMFTTLTGWNLETLVRDMTTTKKWS